jgi:hypothetical protein
MSSTLLSDFVTLGLEFHEVPNPCDKNASSKWFKWALDIPNIGKVFKHKY